MGIDISSIFNRPDGNLNVYFECFGKEYEVKQFSVSFSQPVDGKGEPQSEIHSGTLMLTLSTIPDANLLRWATNDTLRQNGSIVFKNETETPALRIEFYDGVCVSLSQKINMGSGSLTSFSISSPEMRMNDMLIDKNWVK
ncbi:MAG: type VI secretion system needle protein Hcp [Paludibacteraceae bacterium]|nr:type VI secretion system needle protein Hcp [Paludibacteraceae bacterium]